MAEPTGSLTFYDLVTRIAELVGVAYYGSTGQGKAVAPIDQHDLDKCKRVVNDGMRLFISNAPEEGWRWMRRTASILFNVAGTGTLNIDTDAARYMLPEDFGGAVKGPIVYAKDSGIGTEINWTNEGFIRERRANNVQTGYPNLAAVLPYLPANPALGASRRWELMVDPAPSSALTVQFPYIAYFDGMKLEGGIATGGSSTTLADSTRKEANDYFNGWILTVASGTGEGETATITDYTKATGTFLFTGLSGGSTPDTTSSYVVQPVANVHPAGFQFDEAIKSACIAQAEMEYHDVISGAVDYFFKSSLPNAHRIDRASAPRTVGNLNRNVDMRIPKRNWEDVTYGS